LQSPLEDADAGLKISAHSIVSAIGRKVLQTAAWLRRRVASGAPRRVAARSPLTVPPTDHATVGAGITARLQLALWIKSSSVTGQLCKT
jgi:hypothetical protein